MKSRWIVGGGAYLDLVFRTWAQARPDESLEKIEVQQEDDYAFDLGLFDLLDPADGAMFVAFDERFGNFKRMELMQAAMTRGFSLESFVHPSAVVDVSAVIGKNVFIGINAVVGHDVRIDYNSVLHAGVYVGPGSHIKPSCWIENGVQIGAGVEVGANGIVRMGASISASVKIGKGCELGWPRLYDKEVPSKTIFDVRYNEPIRTYQN